MTWDESGEIVALVKVRDVDDLVMLPIVVVLLLTTVMKGLGSVAFESVDAESLGVVITAGS